MSCQNVIHLALKVFVHLFLCRQIVCTSGIDREVSVLACDWHYVVYLCVRVILDANVITQSMGVLFCPQFLRKNYELAKIMIALSI